MNLERRDQYSVLAITLGLLANIILAVVKTVVGIAGNSPALLAEGINSTSDVVYTAIASIFIRMARQPADEEHPYGHRQLESIAALVVGAFIITTAVAVFWDAVNKVYALLSGVNGFEGAAPIAFWIALLTVGFKLLLSLYTRNVGKLTENPLVLALAFDHRNDVLSASAAALGIFLGQRGYPWVDPLAGALVALLILRTGIEILRDSSNELMDAVPSLQLRTQVQELLSSMPGVNEVEEVHAHRFGPYLVMNLTICVDGTLSVAAGDRIATDVEDRLCANIPLLKRVYVHFHPGGECRSLAEEDLQLEQK